MDVLIFFVFIIGVAGVGLHLTVGAASLLAALAFYLAGFLVRSVWYILIFSFIYWIFE